MGCTDVVPLVLLSMKPHASAFFSSCLAPSELLYIILRPLACRPIDMLLACLKNVSPCLPPHGAMEDYDLHWTDTPTTWIFASRAMRRNGSLSTGHSFAEREKTEEEGGIFTSIGQEASMGASISDASQQSSRWSKVVGVLEHPGSLWRLHPCSPIPAGGSFGDCSRLLHPSWGSTNCRCKGLG